VPVVPAGTHGLTTYAATPDSCVPVPRSDGRFATYIPNDRPQLWTSLWTDRLSQGRRPT
jgi:hypothetical protein